MSNYKCAVYRLNIIIFTRRKLFSYPIDWQLSIPNINTHAYSYPLPSLCQWGLTQLGFKRHQGSHYSSQCSRKLWFRHYYQWIFLQVALPLWVLEVHINVITGVTIRITESKFKISWFDTIVGLLLFITSSNLDANLMAFPAPLQIPNQRLLWVSRQSGLWDDKEDSEIKPRTTIKSPGLFVCRI